jgi:hypothetical protein
MEVHVPFFGFEVSFSGAEFVVEPVVYGFFGGSGVGSDGVEGLVLVMTEMGLGAVFGGLEGDFVAFVALVARRVVESEDGSLGYREFFDEDCYALELKADGLFLVEEFFEVHAAI